MGLNRSGLHPALLAALAFLFTLFQVLAFTQKSLEFTPWALVFCLFAPTLLFFFRLQLFEKLKTGLSLPPLSLTASKALVLPCLVLELSLIYWVSPLGFLFYLTAVTYSLLAYEDFFIGEYLKNKIVSSKLFSNLASGLLSIAIGISALSIYRTFGGGRSDVLEQLFGKSLSLAIFEKKFWLLAAMNWLYLNSLVFSPKNFSTEEIARTLGPSQSLASLRAAILSVSQFFLALVCWFYFRTLSNMPPLPWLSLITFGLAVLWTLICLKRIHKPLTLNYQLGALGLLLVQYLALIVELGISS